MAIEAFLVPMVGTGAREDPYRGKYTDGDPSIVRSGTLRNSRTDYGIAVIEADQPWLDTAAADPDVTRLSNENNIDQVLDSNQANAAKAVFEALDIPDQFINAGDTRREVLRGVAGMMLFSQRMEGRFGAGQSLKQRARAAGLTLNSTWAEFPQGLKDEFIEIRDDHGWGSMGLTNASTLREIMVAISQQWESTPIYIASFEL